MNRERETDPELLRRLLYVAGDSDSVRRELLEAGTVQLDEIAARFGLKRNGGCE